MNKNIKDSVIMLLLSTTVLGTGVTMNNMHNDNINLSKELLKEQNLLKKEKDKTNDLTKELKSKTEELSKEEQKIKELENEKAKLQKKINALSDRPLSVKHNGSGTPVRMTLTFYGDFAHENGGYAGIDCNGNKLTHGTVASNVHPQGTQFYYNGSTYTVRDRGGSNFNSSNRLDVFVPRRSNESSGEYARRISNMGKQTVTMYKLN